MLCWLHSVVEEYLAGFLSHHSSRNCSRARQRQVRARCGSCNHGPQTKSKWLAVHAHCKHLRGIRGQNNGGRFRRIKSHQDAEDIAPFGRSEWHHVRASSIHRNTHRHIRLMESAWLAHACDSGCIIQHGLVCHVFVSSQARRAHCCSGRRSRNLSTHAPHFEFWRAFAVDFTNSTLRPRASEY